MKKVLPLILAFTTMALTTTAGLTAQSPDEEEARRPEAAAAAARQAYDRMLQQQDADRAKWVDGQRQALQSSLANAAVWAADMQAKENETRFADLRQNADALLTLSQRIHDQVYASGAYSVSINLFPDLDSLETTLKELRKAAK